MFKMMGNIIWNLLTSGKSHDKRNLSDYTIRYLLLNFTSIFGFIFLIYFVFDNYDKGIYVDAGICIGMAVIAFIAFIIARTEAAHVVPIQLIISFYIVFCVLLIWSGNSQGMNFLFIYLFPPLTLMLQDLRRSIIYSIILFVAVCIELFIPNVSNFTYAADIAGKILINYILIVGIAITVEAARAAKERSNHKLTAKLIEETNRAEAATLAKSNFLANTSHEIRTPMNAILGMVELILRRNISQETYIDAMSIKQAGESLLSIINDILDFSKIESGKMEIVSGDYYFESLINDVVNIIRMRIGDKHIRLITNIDGAIPAKLYGDMIRIRQILLNILSNAVKYTESGYIKLSAVPEINGKGILLHFEVSDTGQGIKKNDMNRLFGDFTRLDSHRNHEIEGTGLGLAISRNLCRLMGGDISVYSKYGEGSIFTINIPQKIQDMQPIAKLEKSESKQVLLYERRNVYRESLIYSLTNLGVPFTVASSEDVFEKLKKEDWAFAFVAPDIAERLLTFLNEEHQKTTMVILANLESDSLFQKIPMLKVPANTAIIAKVLNGVKTDFIREKTTQRFTAPTAKILIVDDLSTNLAVAKGLLSPYQLDITTCTSGREAISLVQQTCYDLVFMDHMMPDMDGIEAVAAIRVLGDFPEGEYFKTLPIIALTANAVTGMKEMFLQRGFNDYISKPIEMSKLDTIIGAWIPENKRVQAGAGNTGAGKTDIRGGEPPPSSDDYPQLTRIGIDVKKGIAMTGGTDAGYRKVLASFCKDALKRLPGLEDVPGEGDLPLFTIGVHALKSAAATIGATDIAKQSKDLELVGNAGDLKTIERTLPGFHRDLKSLTEQIGLTLGSAETEKNGGTLGGVLPRHIPLLTTLQAALENKNIAAIDSILTELEKEPFDEKTKERLAEISDSVLMTEFEVSIEKTINLLNIAESSH
jgi:signal transduction histidine kinase/CheY-like chemotaxis protein